MSDLLLLAAGHVDAATPSRPSSAGWISVWRDRARRRRAPCRRFAAIDAMITGRGVDVERADLRRHARRQLACWRFCSIVACVSLTSVPNENCAITSEIELADED